MASIFDNPYVAFSITLMGGGDVGDAFSAFRNARDFREEQKRYALQEQRAKQIIEEANREAQYKEQIDQVISRGGDIESIFREIQPLMLGLTDSFGQSMLPGPEFQTITETPETQTTYEINPYTGERKAVGQGYTGFGGQMKYLQANEAMQKRLADYRHGLTPQPGADESLMDLVKGFTPEKASAFYRSGLAERIQDPGLQNYFSTLAQRNSLDTGIDELVYKINAGQDLSTEETARLNLLMNMKRTLSPSQALEQQFFQNTPGLEIPTLESMIQDYQDQSGSPDMVTGGMFGGEPAEPEAPKAPQSPTLDPYSPEAVQGRMTQTEKKKKKKEEEEEEKKKKKEAAKPAGSGWTLLPWK